MNKGLLLSILILLVFLDIIVGQKKIEGFSINPKIGMYMDDGGSGFILGSEINIIRNHFIYSIDYYHYEEWAIIFDSEPSEYFNQIGIIAGKYVGERVFRLQYQGGISAFWGQRRTSLIKEGGLWSGDLYNSDRFSTLGLDLKLGIKFIPIKYFSIGLDIQTNLNPKKVVTMNMISIEIGKLRNKIDKSKPRKWIIN